MNLLKSLMGAGVASIDAAEAQRMLKGEKPPFLLDVRQPEEFKAARVDGAELIPLGELDRRLGELPKDRQILVICRSGARSTSATRQLIGAGYEAININGGLIGWQHAGLPIRRG